MPRAGPPVHLRGGVLDLAQRAVVGRPDRATVPGQAGRVVVGVEKQAGVFEIARRPQPEELRRCGRDQRLRIAQADGPHAPGAVTGPDKAVDPLAHAIEFDPALIASVLRQPGIVHQGARTDPPDEARLLDRRAAAGEDDIGGDAAIRRVDGHAQFVQRLDHFDADRANGKIHPFHVETSRGMQRGFHPVADHDKSGIGDVQVRINAERGCEERRISGLVRIAVEKIAVVEIAVSPRIGHRLRRLVDRIVIALAQRQMLLPVGRRLFHHSIAPRVEGREVNARGGREIRGARATRLRAIS